MDFAFMCKHEKPQQRGKKVAIIGAGPAGLVAAGYLACQGYSIDVYDKLPEPGGLLLFGIPEFRIPSSRVRGGINILKEVFEVNFIQKTKVFCGSKEFEEGDEFVSSEVNLEELISKYDATLIATGAWKSNKLNIPGEDLEGVYIALEYLHKYRLAEHNYIPKDSVPSLGGKVAVIGAGLTAVDAAIHAKLIGAREVYVMYRRTINEAPAGRYEIEKLKSMGIKWMELTIPKSIIGDKRVKGIELLRARLGPPDASGRPRPEPIPNSEFIVEVDSILIAIGERPTPPFKDECAGIKVDRKRRVVVNKNYMTSREGVFAAGDVTTGPWNVGKAIGSGLRAARALHLYLLSR
ncbi:MAG: glutamate synthase [Thermoprotei archaeon]|nr:MAG: glutamate synthase [Thermoprotei archaeon]